MFEPLLVVEVLTFTLGWWLGLYLLSRNLNNPQLRFAGLGLVAYALGLAMNTLSQQTADSNISRSLAQWGLAAVFLARLLLVWKPYLHAADAFALA